RGLRAKLGYTLALFRTPTAELPSVELGNGVVLNVRDYTIRIPGKFHLHADGDIRISTNSELILQSGKMLGKETGDLHLNPELNEHGVPLIYHHNIPAEAYGETDHEHTDDCTDCGENNK